MSGRNSTHEGYLEINQILIPEAECEGFIPPGCISASQRWGETRMMCSARRNPSSDGNVELIVFPMHYGLDKDVAGLEEEEDWKVINECGQIMDEVQNKEPKSHPNLQRYLGVDPDTGFSRYEEAIGYVFTFKYTYQETIPMTLKLSWAYQLASVIDFLHNMKHLIHNTIGPRKLMIRPNLTLLLCCLASSSTYPNNGRGAHPSEDPYIDCYTNVPGVGPAGHPLIDIFAFGTMFWYLLSPRIPDQDPEEVRTDEDDIAFQIEINPEQLLSEVTDTNSQKLQNIIRKCWKHEYSNIRLVLDDLRHIIEVDLGLNINDQGQILDKEIDSLAQMFKATT